MLTLPKDGFLDLMRVRPAVRLEADNPVTARLQHLIAPRILPGIVGTVIEFDDGEHFHILHDHPVHTGIRDAAGGTGAAAYLCHLA